MKKLLILPLLVGLIATGPAEAASLAPATVQGHMTDAAEQLSQAIATADGTAGATLDGLGTLGICGKKRGRPYSCRIDVHAQGISSDGDDGWITWPIECTAWGWATRRSAWFPAEWFSCPAAWLPHQ